MVTRRRIIGASTALGAVPSSRPSRLALRNREGGDPNHELRAVEPRPGGRYFSDKFILNGFGCKGKNVHPRSNGATCRPARKSLALQVHDLDAPTGSGFWHWAVYNIPPMRPACRREAGNDDAQLPTGAFAGTNDFLDTGITAATAATAVPAARR